MVRDHYFFIGALGVAGGFLIHLVIGSVYQWGIINVYITSYYKIKEPSLTLEANGVVFPAMMASIGIGMYLGLELAHKYGTLMIMVLVQLVIALLVFISSYLPTFACKYRLSLAFVVVYGVLFGIIGGLNFQLPIVECNKYFPGKKIYVNGCILVGTGLGSAIFGTFSYNFLNPTKMAPNLGYYDGNLQYIAQGVPVCLRYLSLMYLLIGVSGVIMIAPVVRHNHKIECSNAQKNIVAVKEDNECPSLLAAMKSGITYLLCLFVILSMTGPLMINGNYKTYANKRITDDGFLTMVGAIGSMGNGITRTLWNLLFNIIGFRPIIILVMCLNIVILVCLKYSLYIQQLYCFLIFLVNTILGCLFVVVPTQNQFIYGHFIGNRMYAVSWICFSLANFLQYFLVSNLTKSIGFDNIFLICSGFSACVVLLMLAYDFKKIWKFEEGQSSIKISNPQNKIDNSHTESKINMEIST